MNKKCYRYFGGLMKRQTDWLNRMAAQGWRLVRAEKLLYEFESCAPGKYQYCVEYIGQKSKENAEDYAAFLEDCGYQVFFKNINLDWSVKKAVWRPWAEKGGRLSTTATTYNRELLIVEKENDGTPFELHTSEEDRREYQKALRKPWIFAGVFALIIFVVVVVCAGVTTGFQFVNTRHSVRIGYVGNESRNSWHGRYTSLDGTMKKTLRPESTVLNITVETESGTISMEILDTDDNIIFQKTDIGTESFFVTVPGKVTVRIEAEHHKGSFRVEG